MTVWNFLDVCESAVGGRPRRRAGPIQGLRNGSSECQRDEPGESSSIGCESSRVFFLSRAESENILAASETFRLSG